MKAWEPSTWVYRAKGRKPSVDVERVKELRDSGLGASAIAKEMGIGRASVYRALQGYPHSTPFVFFADTFTGKMVDICSGLTPK